MTSQETKSSLLSVARDLIGQKHPFGTYTETQVSHKIYEASPRGSYGYGVLAREVLTDTIREASYMFIHTNGNLSKAKLAMTETSKAAYAFLRGTGLEIMLQAYSIDYDPNSLRTAFYAQFHIKS